MALGPAGHPRAAAVPLAARPRPWPPGGGEEAAPNEALVQLLGCGTLVEAPGSWAWMTDTWFRAAAPAAAAGPSCVLASAARIRFSWGRRSPRLHGSCLGKPGTGAQSRWLANANTGRFPYILAVLCVLQIFSSL